MSAGTVAAGPRGRGSLLLQHAGRSGAHGGTDGGGATDGTPRGDAGSVLQPLPFGGGLPEGARQRQPGQRALRRPAGAPGEPARAPAAAAAGGHAHLRWELRGLCARGGPRHSGETLQLQSVYQARNGLLWLYWQHRHWQGTRSWVHKRLSQPACESQAHARIPALHALDSFTVLPAALSLEHTTVRGLPKSVTAGVPAEFTIHPTDQFGNPGATGMRSFT